MVDCFPFKSTFGKHETLGSNTIKRCHDKLSESWLVSNKNQPNDLPKKGTEEKVAAVRRLFKDDPGRSIRNASSVSGLSYTLVRDILRKDLNFKAWKPKSVQDLFHEDMNHRMEFAGTILELVERRQDLFSKPIWSDKALFHLDGFTKSITITFGLNSHPTNF